VEVKNIARHIARNVYNMLHMPRKNPYINLSAWDYQKGFVGRCISADAIVLDVGSGNYPCPRANVLADFFPEESIHRSGRIMEDRPLVICSVERLPFLRHAFDFVICSHLLEHVESPSRAAAELSRVAQAGYIETPAYGKDILIGTGHMHRWQVVEFEGVLHFFEYSERQKKAHIGSPVMDIWLNEMFHPWQDFFWERQDLFNAMLIWEEPPKVIEYRRWKGKPAPLPQWSPPPEEKLPDQPCALNSEEIELLESRLASPDGLSSMHFRDRDGCFVDGEGKIVYPVRGKRIYCEFGTCETTPSRQGRR
jgi:SAM-dependent methyltransferase